MQGIKPRINTRRAITNLSQREMGRISPLTFANSVGVSEGIFRSLGIKRKLNEHQGCVNTLCFNYDGSILMSGSDDKKIVLWDWETGLLKYSLVTGHAMSIYDAQFLSWSNDSIITCGSDGEVRDVKLSEGASTERELTGIVVDRKMTHNMVHKMAVEPGTDCFYACSEFGIVNHFDLRAKKEHTMHFHVMDSSGWTVELLDIAIDPTNPKLFAVAGSEPFARIYDIRMFDNNDSSPSNYHGPLCIIDCMVPRDSKGISGLAFSNTGELLVSHIEKDIYLFPREQVNSGVNDSDGYEPKVFRGHSNEKTIKGVYFLGPDCEYVASGSDSGPGRAFIWRKKDGEILRILEGDSYVLNCIEHHPLVSGLATSGHDNDVKVWAPKTFEPKHIEEVVDEKDFLMVTLKMADSEEGSFYGDNNNGADDSRNDDDHGDCYEQDCGGGEGDLKSEDEMQCN